MSKEIITQDYLNHHFSYDPESGSFTYKIPTRRRKVGATVGKPDKDGYLTASIGCNRIIIHRAIWMMIYGEWPNVVDHINGDKTDNRLLNIRNVTNNENLKNSRLSKRNKSGVTGVIWHKRFNKWHVGIGVNSKLKHIGYYHSYFDAVCARKSAEIRYGYHPLHGGNKLQAEKSPIRR